MALERIEIIPIRSCLTPQKRKLIDAEIDKNALLYDRKVEYKWLKRGDEKFLRVVVAPATFEIVFYDDRVELYGAAPVWAKLLFTNAHRNAIQERVREFLLAAGFIEQPAAVA